MIRVTCDRDGCRSSADLAPGQIAHQLHVLGWVNRLRSDFCPGCAKSMSPRFRLGKGAR